MIRGSCWLSFRSTPIREYLRVPYWLLFNVCPAIYAFPHFESRTPNVSVFYITEWSFWCSNEFNGGQCEMKLRRLQQASFLPCTVENDKRQLQAQSQSRSTSKSGISSGAFLVVLQLTMDIMLSPLQHLLNQIEKTLYYRLNTHCKYTLLLLSKHNKMQFFRTMSQKLDDFVEFSKT